MRMSGLDVMTDPLRWHPTVDALVGAWGNCVVGVRRDITVKAFDSEPFSSLM